MLSMTDRHSGQNILLTRHCQEFNLPLPKPLIFFPKFQRLNSLTLERMTIQDRLYFFFFFNASLCDWVRRWVLTEKSPRRLCYLSKAQFRLFLIKAACSRYKGRTCHSAHVCHPRVSWKAERQLICRTTDNHSLASLLHTHTRSYACIQKRQRHTRFTSLSEVRLPGWPVGVWTAYAGVGAFASKHG